MLSENKDFEDTFAEYHDSQKKKYAAAIVLTFAVLAAITIYGIGQMAAL